MPLMACWRRQVPEGVIRDHQIEGTKPGAAVLDIIKDDNDYPYVHTDHPLSHALERMGAKGVDVVPVVSHANIHQMYGIMKIKAILATYGVIGDDGAIRETAARAIRTGAPPWDRPS